MSSTTRCDWLKSGQKIALKGATHIQGVVIGASGDAVVIKWEGEAESLEHSVAYIRDFYAPHKDAIDLLLETLDNQCGTG